MIKKIGCYEDGNKYICCTESECDGFVEKIGSLNVCKYKTIHSECFNIKVIDEIKTRKLISKNTETDEQSIRETLSEMISVGNDGFFTEHNVLQLIIAGKIPHVKYVG